MGDWAGTVPTILAGDIPTGDDWGAVTDELTAVQASWTAFSPSWTGSTGNPSLGNGTLTGSYRRIGKSVDFAISLVIGSTTTFGSGAYAFSLPTGLDPVRDQCCSCVAIDSSATARYGGAVWLTSSGGAFRWLLGSGGNAGASSTIPFTWATGDEMLITGTYEMS